MYPNSTPKSQVKREVSGKMRMTVVLTDNGWIETILQYDSCIDIKSEKNERTPKMFPNNTHKSEQK